MIACVENETSVWLFDLIKNVEIVARPALSHSLSAPEVVFQVIPVPSQ